MTLPVVDLGAALVVQYTVVGAEGASNKRGKLVASSEPAGSNVVSIPSPASGSSNEAESVVHGVGASSARVVHAVGASPSSWASTISIVVGPSVVPSAATSA
jgi:hypothetical protein